MDRALDLRLQEVRNRALHVDPLLAQLVNWCSSTATQIGIVCVLGATVVRGVPTSTVESADALDDEVRFFLDIVCRRAEAIGATAEAEQLAGLAEEFAMFGSTAREAQQRRASIIEWLGDRELPGNLADLPPDMQDPGLELSLPPKAVTLSSAQVRYADGDWEDVGTLRVLLSQVHAWWSFRLGVPDDVTAE